MMAALHDLQVVTAGVCFFILAGWRMSEENSEPLRKVVDNVKLRASWGQLGNQVIL